MSGPVAETFVVDVCGTLVWEDTTIGLLRYHLDRAPERRWRAVCLKLLVSRSSPLFWIFVALERLLRLHVLKHVLVRLLKGDSTQDLEQSAQEYAHMLWRERRVPAVWSAIQDAAAGGRVVLASASLEPVVRNLASLLSARYVASSLDVRHGVLTGRYGTDITGDKIRALREQHAVDVTEGGCCVISDNWSDRLLLSHAAHAVVVLHRASHRSRWGALKAQYLEIGNCT
jgi:phosphoserine phosphatase